MLSILALPATAASEAGRLSASGSIGAGFPTGALSEDILIAAEPGPQLVGALEYGVSGSFAIGVDGGALFLKQPCEGTSKCFKNAIRHAAAFIKYYIPMASESAIAPYAIAGVGAYDAKSIELTGDGQARFRRGVRFGLGGLFAATEGLSIGVEADFTTVSADEAATGGLSSIDYVGVRGLIQLRVSGSR